MMNLISIRFAVTGLFVLLLTACAPTLRLPSPPPAAPSSFPENVYREAAATERVYRIDPTRSQVLIYVYRDGPLAKVGHDHVVASHDVRGYVLLTNDLADARTDLYFPVATLSVDEPALRRNAGFTTELSAEDIESTRRRMLQVVLDADSHPFVGIHAAPASMEPSHFSLNVELTLHGVTRALKVPAKFASDAGQLTVRGEFDLRQTDFDITPFSILNGALAVKDELHVIFDLTGVRVRQGE